MTVCFKWKQEKPFSPFHHSVLPAQSVIIYHSAKLSSPSNIMKSTKLYRIFILLDNLNIKRTTVLTNTSKEGLFKIINPPAIGWAPAKVVPPGRHHVSWGRSCNGSQLICHKRCGPKNIAFTVSELFWRFLGPPLFPCSSIDWTTVVCIGYNRGKYSLSV